MLDSKTGSPIAQIIIFDWNKQSTHTSPTHQSRHQTSRTMFKRCLRTQLFAVSYIHWTIVAVVHLMLLGALLVTSTALLLWINKSRKTRDWTVKEVGRYKERLEHKKHKNEYKHI